MELGISSALKTLFEQLGKSFFISGYLPAALFVALNQYLVFSERFGGKSIALFASDFKLGPFTGDNLVTVILPLFLGMLLLAFNTLIIQFFEGAWKWQQKSMFRPWMARNLKQREGRYGKLVMLKKEYFTQLARAASPADEAERNDALIKVTGLRLQIQQENDRLEQIEPMPTLPYREERIRPTALGNTFALMEEYPYDRYGIDSVAIWPRLQPLLPDAVKSNIANQKLLLDFMLNLVTLAGIFGIEGIASGLARSPMQLALIGAGGGSLVVAWLLYRASVSVTATMGLFVTAAFDFYRGLVLEKFGLAQPESVEDEQFVWLRLEAFLRRGEGFKLPPRVKPATAEKK
jgi:hypothetical protein